MSDGRPIFNYPPEHRAPEGEGCQTCGIVLEADAIGNYCSPECCEWEDRCESCDRGQTWCQCEYTHCIDCGTALSNRDVERKFRLCRGCAGARIGMRRAIGPSRHPPLQNIPVRTKLGRQIRQHFFGSRSLSKDKE